MQRKAAEWERQIETLDAKDWCVGWGGVGGGVSETSKPPGRGVEKSRGGRVPGVCFSGERLQTGVSLFFRFPL